MPACPSAPVATSDMRASGPANGQTDKRNQGLDKTKRMNNKKYTCAKIVHEIVKGKGSGSVGEPTPGAGLRQERAEEPNESMGLQVRASKLYRMGVYKNTGLAPGPWMMLGSARDGCKVSVANRPQPKPRELGDQPGTDTAMAMQYLQCR